MRKLLWLVLLLPALGPGAAAQSLELMPGDRRLFADVQFFAPLRPAAYRWTLFSRTRATLDYENRADLFSAAYLNYTHTSGVGVSGLGSLGAGGGAAGAGIHVYRSGAWGSVFALLSVGVKAQPDYSWFSILRYQPRLSPAWRAVAALELYSLWDATGHRYSVTRARLGLDHRQVQGGLAANLQWAGPAAAFDRNLGLFVRKVFD